MRFGRFRFHPPSTAAIRRSLHAGRQRAPIVHVRPCPWFRSRRRLPAMELQLRELPRRARRHGARQSPHPIVDRGQRRRPSCVLINASPGHPRPDRRLSRPAAGRPGARHRHRRGGAHGQPGRPCHHGLLSSARRPTPDRALHRPGARRSQRRPAAVHGAAPLPRARSASHPCRSPAEADFAEVDGVPHLYFTSRQAPLHSKRPRPIGRHHHDPHPYATTSA